MTGNAAAPAFMLEYERPHLYPKQCTAIFDPHRYSLIEASAQPLDSVIQTPDGPRRFGSLRVGDQIFSVDGSITKVTGVFPKGVQAVYEIHFLDGAITRASGDHLWKVRHPRDGQKVLTTDKIRSFTKNSRALLKFPVAAAVEYPHRPVSIDPWLLGVLIGDGSLCGNAIGFSTADSEIVARVRSSLPSGYEVRAGGNYSYRIVARARGAGYEKPNIRYHANGYEVSVGRRYVGRASTLDAALEIHKMAMRAIYGDDLPEINLRQELRALGLLGLKHNEKFVPESYLRNSIEIRLEVLRGLMDTDGSAGRGRGAVIEQTSERLAYEIVELARSLGGVGRIAVHEARNAKWKRSYRVNIRHDDIASFFWLPRKKIREALTGRYKKIERTISDIVQLPDAEVQCISVAHKSKLYLTDDYIVTHNTKAGKTSGCIAWLVEHALAGEPGWNYWWVAPVSDQALIAFRRMMRSLPQDVFTANISLKTLTLINGTVIWFKSGDKPNSLYGEDVYGVVVDEASRMKEDAYIAIRTTLTYTRAPIRIIGNVRGRKNWFYQLARRAEQEQLRGTEPREMSYHKIIAADAVAAGVLDAKEIENAKSQMPEIAWRELYLAEASDDGGNPFGLTHIQACIAPLSTDPPCWWGWDLAKRQDYTVGIGLDARGKCCRFERFHHLPWGEIMNKIVFSTGGLPALVDSTGVGDPIVDQLKTHRGTLFDGYHFTPASKQKLMEGLALAIQERTVTYPEGTIVQELEQFEYELTRTGVRYSAPAGYYDDCVVALSLAVMCRTATPPRIVVSPDLLARIQQTPPRRRYR
jgi:LAGLIDADG-like domain